MLFQYFENALEDHIEDRNVLLAGKRKTINNYLEDMIRVPERINMTAIYVYLAAKASMVSPKYEVGELACKLLS